MSLRARGLATVDVPLEETTDPESTAAQTRDWLDRLRKHHPGPLGLIGVERLATTCAQVAAIPELGVVSLVLAPGDFEVEILPPRGCATRLIGPANDPDYVHRVDTLSDVLGSSLDVVLHPALDDAVLEALCLEWFSRTLVASNGVGLLEWLRSRLSRRRLHRQLAASMQASAVLVAMATPPARALTITVGGGCTLMDAIVAAESDTATVGCTAGNGSDTVVLGGGTYLLNSTYGSALPPITTPITISGNGAVLDGEAKVRVLEVEGGELQLLTATVTGGTAASGGGIYNNSGTITITSSTISGNSASSGGGIYNNGGTVTITSSTISGNSASGGGGVYNHDGGLTLTQSTISGNTATRGGGIYNLGTQAAGATVTVQGGSLMANSASRDGGGIANLAGQGSTAELTVENVDTRQNQASQGGAISVGGLSSSSVVVTVSDSAISANTVTAGGGALALASDGLGAQATISVTGSTLTGNTAGNTGGAIDVAAGNGATVSITVAANQLTSNSAGMGGGAISAATTLGSSVSILLSHSLLLGNTVGLDGGALRATAIDGGSLAASVRGGSIAGNVAGGKGGGMFLRSMESMSSVSVLGASLSGNSASGHGGGIYSAADAGGAISATVEASTISGNTADSGGGIYAVAMGQALLVTEIRNGTISGNTAATGSGGGIRQAALDSSSSALKMESSALSGNSAAAGGSIDLAGESQNLLPASLNNSIVTKSLGSGDCVATGNAQFLGANNLLDELGSRGVGSACDGLGQGAVTGFDTALSDNGGPTLTHALLPGSNAIDAGAGDCAGLSHDQRGARRPLDGTGDGDAICDIGPVEVGETPIFSDGFESGDPFGWDQVTAPAPKAGAKRHDR